MILRPPPRLGGAARRGEQRGTGLIRISPLVLRASRALRAAFAVQSLGRFDSDRWPRLVALPILCVPWLALFPEENIWPHLASTVLPGYVRTTLFLMLGVAVRRAPHGRHQRLARDHVSLSGATRIRVGAVVAAGRPRLRDCLCLHGSSRVRGTDPDRSFAQLTGWQSAADYWFPEIRSIGVAPWP